MMFLKNVSHYSFIFNNCLKNIFIFIIINCIINIFFYIFRSENLPPSLIRISDCSCTSFHFMRTNFNLLSSNFNLFSSICYFFFFLSNLFIIHFIFVSYFTNIVNRFSCKIIRAPCFCIFFHSI